MQKLRWWVHPRCKNGAIWGGMVAQLYDAEAVSWVQEMAMGGL